MTHSTKPSSSTESVTAADSQPSDRWVFRGLWVATAVYVGLLLLSPPAWLPGEPIWAIKPDTIQEILDESINFFFILPLLNWVGIAYPQAPAVHPAAQSFFNLAEAWIFMFLPLMLLDQRSQHLPRILFWGAAMFLTNVFLMPYMALRLNRPEAQASLNKGILARLLGAVGLTVGALAVIWFCGNQPELGGIMSRFAYLGRQIMTDRVTLAFTVDIVLFWTFQIWLMGAVIPAGEGTRALRFFPFLGLGLWLLL